MKHPRARHILTLAWEYPPKVIGGLARHVGYLSRALVQAGHHVTVLTQGDAALPPEEKDQGVHVLRLPVHEPRPRDFTGWVKRLNFEMIEQAIRLYAEGQRFDVLHAHDWLAAYAGKTLKHGLAIPLIATVHATEYGRNNGLHNDLQRYISTVEWSLTYEAWRVICCSRFMEQEIHRVFQTPLDKIRVVPNGVPLPAAAAESIESSKGEPVSVRPSASDPVSALTPDDAEFRRTLAAPHEPLLFFMGRLVFEKGIHVLLEALPQILLRHPGVRVVVAGDGPLKGQLEQQARALGVAERVTFYGFADDEQRDRLLRVAQVAVFPSLYEPFGIVALEAMAAGVPVVVGAVGGFAEIVTRGQTGLHAAPGDARALADAVVDVLSNPGLADRLRGAARRDVATKYSWDRIAGATAGIYEEVLAEYGNSRWARRPRPGPLAAGSTARDEAPSPPLAGGVGRYTDTGMARPHPSDPVADAALNTAPSAGDAVRKTV